MHIIQKAKETMTSKERVLKTFNLEKTDRVTIGYEANTGIHMRLARALGIDGGNKELVNEALGVDYRAVPINFIGEPLFAAVEGRRVDPVDGYHTRWVDHETGGYWAHCDFPLKDAEDEDFYSYSIPNPDDFDYELAHDFCKSQAYYATYLGNPGIPDIINSNGRIMGMEDVLCHLALEDEAALYFINKRAEMYLSVFERMFDKCKGLIDFMWIGEDLGTQNAPIVSLEIFRKHIKPVHKEFVDLAGCYGVPVLVHTCGSSSWAYEDFIEMGVRGVDTLQPEAANMSPAYLKEHFGGRLCFRGCISTAGPLAYSGPDETELICRETLEIMMNGYGYHFAPTHFIQDNTPVNNVIAMYNTAHKYGVY